MPQSRDRSSALEPVRRVSQIRQYSPEPVPEDVVDKLLELARWTGSAKNGQPWRFIVVRDKERLKKIAALRPPIGWLAGAPLGIAVVLGGPGEVVVDRDWYEREPRDALGFELS